MVAEIQFTVLCDNHGQGGLQTEHGFAIWLYSPELNSVVKSRVSIPLRMSGAPFSSMRKDLLTTISKMIWSYG